MHDLRFALRQLVRSRGFTAVALVTLALGIGLNTSMFSLMNTLLLRPLPFPEKDRLVRVYRTTPQSQDAGHSAPDYLALQRESSDFIEFAAYRPWAYTLSPPDRPAVSLAALRVSGGFFSVLGMQPQLGRVFTSEDDRPGSRVIMLSYSAWQSQFGGDPAVVGSTVRVDSEPETIIGVMPAAFSSVLLLGPADVFRPLAHSDEDEQDWNESGLQIIGRFSSDMSLDQVSTRLDTLAARLAETRPRQNSADGLRVIPLEAAAGNPTNTRVTWLLLGLSGFVLLIACANLANLQLARAIARGRESAICAALGASRSQLLRPLLAESLLLSLLGGALGVLLAQWSNDWIGSRISNEFVQFTIGMDWRVLGFALGLSVLTGAMFGLAPAWLTSRVQINETLRSGGRGATADRSHHRFRHLLIVGQFALVLILLASAGFFIRGLNTMLTRDTGWTSDGLLQGVINLPQSRYSTPEQTYSFYTQLQERLRALPGVDNVAIGRTLPVFRFLTTRSYVVEGRGPPAGGHEPMAFFNAITPSWLDTLEVALAAGRNFTAADNQTAPPVVIINESMARALFPDRNPIGQRIGVTDPENRTWIEIVGVVRDMQFTAALDAPATPFQVLAPLAQEQSNYVNVTLRSSAPETLAEPLRRVVAEMDPDLPVQQLGTVEEQIRAETGLSLVSTILASFATLGLLLAALGLYGVIARLVVQRTPEIGVRLALGAQTRDVVRLILALGIKLAVIGAAIGLMGSFAIGRLLAATVPEMTTQDPWAIAAVTLLLMLVALVSCWLPARNAAKVDPIVALRAE